MNLSGETLPLDRESEWKLSEAILRGRLGEFTQKYHPTLRHFLIKNEADITPLHRAAATGHLDQVADILRASGEKLSVDDLFIENEQGETPFGLAAMNGHLDQVFAPSLWIGRVKEMTALWDQVIEECRDQVDFDAALKETIWQSVHAEKSGPLTGAGMTRSTPAKAKQEDLSQGKV